MEPTGTITITKADDAQIALQPNGDIVITSVPAGAAVFDDRPTAAQAYQRGPAPAASSPATPVQSDSGAPKPYASEIAVVMHPELGNITNTNVETRTTTAPTDEFAFPHTRVVNWQAGATVTLPWPASQETTVVRASGARGKMRFQFTPPAGLSDNKPGHVTIFEAPGAFLSANVGLWPAGFNGELTRISEQLQLEFYVGGPARDSASILAPEAVYEIPVEIVDGPNAGGSFAILLASPARY